MKKRCSMCGKEKALDLFYKKGSRFSSRCKKCELKIKKINYKKKSKERKRKAFVKEIVESFSITFNQEPDKEHFVSSIKPLIDGV